MQVLYKVVGRQGCVNNQSWVSSCARGRPVSALPFSADSYWLLGPPGPSPAGFVSPYNGLTKHIFILINISSGTDVQVRLMLGLPGVALLVRPLWRIGLGVRPRCWILTGRWVAPLWRIMALIGSWRKACARQLRLEPVKIEHHAGECLG